MSNESYVAEEYEKVKHLPHFANIDCVQLLDGDGRLTLKQFHVGGVVPAEGSLYTVTSKDEADVLVAEKLPLRRQKYEGEALELIKSEAAHYLIDVFYKRSYSGHEDGIIEGGDPVAFPVDESMTIVKGGAFKGLLLNWIGCAQGSWWNGINQCALMIDGTTLGDTAGIYSFDYDDSAYYGKDGWRLGISRK